MAHRFSKKNYPARWEEWFLMVEHDVLLITSRLRRINTSGETFSRLPFSLLSLLVIKIFINVVICFKIIHVRVFVSISVSASR